jgi:hypothetical protein
VASSASRDHRFVPELGRRAMSAKGAARFVVLVRTASRPAALCAMFTEEQRQ